MGGEAPKVLHLIDTGGPGGAETVFLELVTRLSGRRWTPVPVVPTEHWLSGALRSRGHDPTLLAGRRSFDHGFLWDLRSLVKREGVALIHAHLMSSGVYGTLAALGRGIPLICTFHGLPDVPDGGTLRWLKIKLLARSMNRIVFVSDSLRRGMAEEKGWTPRDSVVIPNGIDCQEFHVAPVPDLKSELGLDEGALLLGAVGNVRPSKRYDVLLQAFRKVVAVRPEVRLAIVGQAQGELYESMLALRSSLGLDDSVHFLGFREGVARAFQGLDLFVLSSSDEGFSLSTVQAMATGLPIVATRCGGPEEILEAGVEGVLVEKNRPDELAAGILEVLSRPDGGRSLGEAARKGAVARFSVDTMVERYDTLYESCLDRG